MIILASDLDGTLLQNGSRTISDEFFEVAKELIQTGDFTFFAASGRQLHSLEQLFEPIKDDIGYICENGGCVFYKGELLYRYEYPHDLAKEISLMLLESEGTQLLLSGTNTSYLIHPSEAFAYRMEFQTKNNIKLVDSFDDIPESIVKIAFFEPDQPSLREEYWLKRIKEKDETLNVVPSGSFWLDIIPYGVNKASGLKHILNRFGETADHIYAFGDNYNDTEMLQFTPNSVAVENAQEGILKMCTYTTPTVAEFLRKHFL